MANPEHLAILKQGVQVWNQWRKDKPLVMPDFFAADSGGAFSTQPKGFGEKPLLTRADLHSADLRLADLRGGDLVGVDLRLADLRGANLQDANLTEAILSWTNLNGAHLRGADFTGVLLEGTVLCDVDLHEVRGLDRIQHWGPSMIGIDTIYKSQGKIPESFLRGAGVPENFITFMKSLTDNALEFYSCFISYSTKDQAFADRLHADLQSQGVRCWFAPHDIQGGKKLHEQIDEAIRVYDRLLLILSEASMGSEWVKTEIANARQREIREKRQMLFPISLVPFEKIREWKAFDADTDKDSAREIRAYFIPDFSNWKDHDSYAAAFQRLLRDLKAEV